MSDNTDAESEAETRTQDAGFDDWIDAAAEDDAYYLECPNGHGSLPPRRVCPDCGETDLEEAPLPETGEIQTFTVTHVPTPAFEEDAPYATAIANFGPVRITGQVVGVDPETVENGLEVEIEITVSETTGERVLGFRPV
ncbi:nucleic acid-binding protein [Natronorubrum sp. JWXQ-INN-674]|uniref:Nucleic acid-binding protein n=1 Tax=Natronorubrum halalkaliphilum TaxID=2691917 RepID=A0A6B0VP66_9EURY|nr:Zn-ribbon domain-containing OB-fold protein [Natronorubrum halalkaliphilum]MXV63304.1 nucleic acid-binding protein [Natronorubrum halalkaliphilum]